MKTCPNCGELLGNGVDSCFKCGYDFITQTGGRPITTPKKVESRVPTKKICPQCRTIYSDISLTHCEKCHVPLAVYTSPDDAIYQEIERSSSSPTKQSKEERLLEKYGLTDLDDKDFATVNWINAELRGNGMLEWGSLLSGAKSTDLVMMSCLRALVEQNWVLLRQLNKMNTRLEEISKKIDHE